MKWVRVGIAAIVMLLVTAVPLIIRAVRQPAPTQVESVVRAAPTTNTALVTAWNARLNSPDTRTVSVLCDSVGNDPGEWVSQWARLLSATRDVTVHHYTYAVVKGAVQGLRWSPTPEKFPARTAGTLPPLTIWNFGWPGGRPSTALTRLATAIPEKPDLVLYSYGHNLTPTTTDPEYRQLLTAVRTRYPAAVPLATLAHMTPTPRPGQATARTHLAKLLNSWNIATVDGRRTLSHPNPTLVKAWFKDDVHPNTRGYAMLAQRLHDALTRPATALTNPPGGVSMGMLAPADASDADLRTVLTLRDATGTVIPYAVATIVREGTTSTIESDANGVILYTRLRGAPARITVTDGVLTTTKVV